MFSALICKHKGGDHTLFYFCMIPYSLKTQWEWRRTKWSLYEYTVWSCIWNRHPGSIYNSGIYPSLTSEEISIWLVYL